MEPTVTFHVSDIPEYLRKSAFFQTLNADDEESITLPAKVFKQSATVTSLEEAAHLLSTLQFWGSDTIPDDLKKIFCIEIQSAINQMLDKFDENFETIRFLREINKGDDAKRVNFVLTKGKLEMVKLLLEQAPEWDRESACKHASISGSLECLEYMHHLGGAIDQSTCAVACRGGFVDCVRYLLENGVEKDSFLTRCAVEYGHLDVLKFLHSQDCGWDSFTARCAAENDHLECLIYLFQNNCPFDADVATGAAASGRLSILKCLFAVGSRWDESTTLNAAYHGQLECLRFLHENGCPWNRSAPAHAALRGHSDCLEYLYENHCPWDSLTTASAAERNNLQMIQYAHERGCPISSTVYRWAARYGNIDMMQYAHNNSVDWEYLRLVTIVEAARSGSLECLMFAHQVGCLIEAEHAHYAAAGGHLTCLQYVLQHVDLPAGEIHNHNVGGTCAAAAEHGHLACLVCLREHQCAWDQRTTKGAAARGSLECLKYAVEQGCTLNREACYVAAVRGKHIKCAEYLVNLAQKEEEETAKAPHRALICCSLA